VERFVAKARSLKLGVTDDCALGPVINERQMTSILAAVGRAKTAGAKVLCGGKRATAAGLANGFYVEPTLVEGISPVDGISTTELFGPVGNLYCVDTFAEAVEMANDSPYGLTACIHTRSFDRAWTFAREIRTGVAVVNAGTFGSEPHMPFGGLRASGNGTREPGTEALDVYSELKDIYLVTEPDRL
jgi:aldehyde dehydrogenase (NAD+)